MKKILGLLAAFLLIPVLAFAVAPDTRISDNDGDVMSVNSDGSIPVSISGDYVQDGAWVVDITSPNALLVRKNNSGDPIFNVNTQSAQVSSTATFITEITSANALMVKRSGDVSSYVVKVNTLGKNMQFGGDTGAVISSNAAGVLSIGSFGGTNNEILNVDGETISNQIGFASGGSGVTNVKWGALKQIINIASATDNINSDVSGAFGVPFQTIIGDNSAADGVVHVANGANASGAHFFGVKTRSATGSDANTIVQTDDEMILIAGYGADGADYKRGGTIGLEVDGTPGASGDLPGRWVFKTRQDGAGGSNTEALRLTTSQQTVLAGGLQSNAVSLGVTVVNAANQACNTTCTSACIFGEDTGALGNFLNCDNAAADSCLCAGPS